MRARMPSMGELTTKIVSAAKALGAQAHVSSHWMSWGKVAVHFPPSGLTLRQRHEQASSLPHFALCITETNEDGGFTARGSVRA